MTTMTVWVLMIIFPMEGAGRQVGPFATQAQCLAAEKVYNERQGRYVYPASKCIEATR